MDITEVNIRTIYTDKDPMKATVSVTLEDQFVVHDILLKENNNRYYVSMPCKRKRKGDYYDIAHPTSKPLREKIESAVIDTYIRLIKKR